MSLRSTLGNIRCRKLLQDDEKRWDVTSWQLNLIHLQRDTASDPFCSDSNLLSATELHTFKAIKGSVREDDYGNLMGLMICVKCGKPVYFIA